LADWRESHLRTDIAVGRGRSELRDRLNRSKTVVLERVARATLLLLLLLLLLLGGHLGTDARCAVLAEATRVDGWRRGIAVAVAVAVAVGVGVCLHGNSSKPRCKIDFHLLWVRLDLRLRVLTDGAANTVRGMSSTRRLVGIDRHPERVFNTLAVRRSAAVTS
jgi:hypothetical protein